MDPGWLTAATALAVAVISGIAWSGRKTWRFLRRVIRFLDDYQGQPARDGQPAVPGFMARLQTVEHMVTDVRGELYPNGGGSLRDVVHKTAADVADIKTEQARVRAGLARMEKR